MLTHEFMVRQKSDETSELNFLVKSISTRPDQSLNEVINNEEFLNVVKVFVQLRQWKDEETRKGIART